VGGKVAGCRFTVPTQPEDLSAAWVGNDLDHFHAQPSLAEAKAVCPGESTS
jgi:hypothetical protein